MSSQHNKKRNVGIIYEQLLQKAASAMVEGDRDASAACAAIIKRHFKPGTELYKEFRLFQALVNTTVKSDQLAIRILGEAKRGSQFLSSRQLELEKSRLIKEINHTLDDTNFFNQPIKDYRLFATVQTLINDWRKDDDASLERVSMYEQKLMDRLLEEKAQSEQLEEMIDHDVSSLTVRVMHDKFEKKWGNRLTETQALLLKDFISGEVNTDMLERIKNRTLLGLKRLKESTRSDVLLEKIDDVARQVVLLETDSLNDEKIVKFMQLAQLQQELEAKDE
jgi:hypothetical protein